MPEELRDICAIFPATAQIQGVKRPQARWVARVVYNGLENRRTGSRNAHESRAVIHRRRDEQARQIHLLDMTVTVSSNVDGQIREEIKTLKDTVEKNHEAVAPHS
ncbi:hypothetical protein ELH53_32925 [Rhizobium ruizarguesonis]|nr:hypothetical protein [Rhizobium leguminosarum]TAT74796.1 hypothetical protein ELI52_28695 [Rhizobium ruizarguesonis]TBY57010.1 hypothetical protein E0H59_05235 [Rhizobium leguminosarum bv. viciae]MBY5857181.1 hypothetical protein [Rhizobium leguminosarum]TAZ87596.1 hypothetical protein ELH67_28950 [Rhizobium ruizarguesonis]